MTWVNWRIPEVVTGPVDVIDSWTDGDGVKCYYGQRALDGAPCFRKGDGEWTTSVDSGWPAFREVELAMREVSER